MVPNSLQNNKNVDDPEVLPIDKRIANSAHKNLCAK